MSNINYFETVAVPVLQQKCQELFNRALILETNLHIEGNKAQRLQEELNKSAAHSSDRIKDLENMYEQLFAEHQTLKTEYEKLSAGLNKPAVAATPPVAQIVKILKGKVSKAVPAVPPTFTEPDDF